MGSISINNKNVKSIVIGGKNVIRITAYGKFLSLNIEPNSFVGTWKSVTKQTEFMNIFTTISPNQFSDNVDITGITLPNVVSIGHDAFGLSRLTYIKIPKATTIGDNAFTLVRNEASTEVWMNHKFNTNAEKDRIFGWLQWNNITFHWTNDDGTDYVPAIIPNSFTGTFSTPAKQSEFMAITDTVSGTPFKYETGITGITLPLATTIEPYAFVRNHLTYISVTAATTIGKNAFFSIVNSPSTNVTMNKKFRTDAEKNLIFGAGHWEHVTFHWINDDGSEFVPSPNTFTGTWKSAAKQTEFEAIRTTIADQQFNPFDNIENGITGISMPFVVNIGVSAFRNAPLTSIKIPKATTIGSNAFYSVVNGALTSVWMNHKFNTDAEKNRIFGSGHWNLIDFHWLNDDGTDYVPPTPSPDNEFTGTFSTTQKRNDFLAIRQIMPADNEFRHETGITGIKLGNTISIPAYAFQDAPLTSIKVPKATDVKRGAFESVVNAPSTEVWINKKYQYDVSKNQIFGLNKWNQITFHWTNDDGSPA